ncbi:MAG: Holliday junction branch migration protein RuvA [Patescibacteria group bacterium]
MISYIEGKVIYRKNSKVIINTGFLGYGVIVSPKLEFRKNENCKLFTYHNVRENLEELYGFSSTEELELFELLLLVNGVGPKAAMQIISSSEIDKIKNSIFSGDAVFFTMIPGIGKKVAGKIILELKSKIGILENKDMTMTFSEDDEVFDTLSTLGYKKHEIEKITHKIPKDIKTTEARVKWYLKNLSK